MKKTASIISILTLLILTSVSPALGKDGGSNSGRDNHGKSGSEVKSENKGKNEVKIENKVENEVEDEEVEDEAEEVQEQARVRIEADRFEVRGTITSISDSTIAVADQTINIDPTQVDEFKQRGLLNVGDFAKVEGIIVNGTKFAREIKVIGEGQGRVQFELRNENIPAPSGANVQTKIKVQGSTATVTAFLEQILGFFKNVLATI
ncbi:MAG: hypothetical protein HYT83_03670 [Candidatus Levybacteria bacterium]|nr:hypothetical protein [Candidatus Levybacteria bacterium]